MQPIVNFLNEAGMLARIPRSGFAFLGTGQQSVSEHSYRTALIGHALATITMNLSSAPVDRYKLLMMCLVHDLPEARIGDLNYVQKKYLTPNLDKALNDIEKGSPLGPEIVEWIKEYEEGLSIEAQIAHDADQIELLLMLKQEQEMGNPRAAEWVKNALKRIKTESGKQLAESILQTSSDDWWFEDRNNAHWIDGGKSKNNSIH